MRREPLTRPFSTLHPSEGGAGSPSLSVKQTPPTQRVLDLCDDVAARCPHCGCLGVGEAQGWVHCDSTPPSLGMALRERFQKEGWPEGLGPSG